MDGDDLDPRRLIVRLAVAVLTADGRIAPGERDALAGLDNIGLGRLSDLVDDEVQRATRQPIDLVATCQPLVDAGPEVATVIASVLCDIAASDREVTAREVTTLSTVATLLGLSSGEIEGLLRAAMSAYGAQLVSEPEPTTVPVRAASSTTAVPINPAAAITRDPSLEQALKILGLTESADGRSIDAAYLDLIARYNPAKVADLGAEFAALAVRKLAVVTDAFQYARDAIAGRGIDPGRP